MVITGVVLGNLNDSRMPHSQAWRTIQQYANAMQERHVATFGFALHKGEWHVTAESRKHKKVALAIQFIVRNVLHLVDAFAVIIGRAVSRLPEHTEAKYSMVLCWRHEPGDTSQHWLSGAPSITSNELVGEGWKQMKFIQTMHNRKADHDLRQLAEPGHSRRHA